MGSSLEQIPIVGPTLAPVDTRNIDQAMADSRALTQYFLQQQGQSTPTPGLTYASSAPVVSPTGEVTGAVAAPQPSASALSAAMQTAPASAATPQPGASSVVPSGRAAPSPVASAPAPGSGGFDAGAFGRAVGSVADPLFGGGYAEAWRDRDPTAGGGSSALIPEGAGLGGSSTPASAPGMVAASMGSAPLMTAAQAQAALGEAALMGETPLAEAARAEAARINQTPQGEFRDAQLGLARSLQDVIAGRAPSVAELQGNRQTGNLQSNIMGNAAAAGRGGNTALALRSALNATARLGGDAVANAALLRAQEGAVARGQAAGLFESARSADIGLANLDAQNVQQANLANATLAQQIALANQGARMTTQQANQQAQQTTNLANQQASQQANLTNAQLAQQAAASNQGSQLTTAQTNAQLLQQANANNQQSQITTRGQNITESQGQAGNVLQANANQAAVAGAQMNAQTQAKQQSGNLVSTAAGLALLKSDRRAKEDISAVPPSAFREFLAAAEPNRWRYKGQPEPHIGPMAQDLERSEIGRTMVRDTPDGKAIDIPAATTALIATFADMHRRVSKLEGRG